MSRRIRWLGVVLILCFAAILVQLVNVQFRQAKALANSPDNPNVLARLYDNRRGDILAANGEVLAQSVKASQGPYHYQRSYPQGPLFSQIVGYSSFYYGTSGVEYEYNDQLIPHAQPARSLGQLLSPPPRATNNVTLTVEPSLQRTAQQALAAIPNANQDGAIVVLDPKTGAVLAMYSSPSFDPNPLASANVATEVAAGHADFQTKDPEGFAPGYPMATFNSFPPGSTFKVVTTTAVYNLDPSLSNFTFPVSGCTSPGQIPNTTRVICNDAGTPQQASPCGGTIAQMLPPSCDPGYAMLGIALGAPTLSKQAELFGFNRVPPIDLNHVSASSFPPVSQLNPPNQGLLAYSAFGQYNVSATALQMAMVASGIADNGVVMTPHVMAEIRNAQGELVQAYSPHPYLQACSAAVAQQVNTLMQAVATTATGPGGPGTAYGIFPASLDVAVKTGTAQTTNPANGQPATTDWMIGFAPANNPKVAAAVVAPFQAVSAYGATIAGPIMRTMLQAALGQPGS